jgi:hypothetical protein
MPAATASKTNMIFFFMPPLLSLVIGIDHWQHFHILTAVALAKVVGNILHAST